MNHSSHNSNNQEEHTIIQVTYRGESILIPITESTRIVQDVKQTLISHRSTTKEELTLDDLKLIYKGTILSNDVQLETLLPSSSSSSTTKTTTTKKPKPIRLFATGISSKETEQLHQEFSKSKRNGPRIKDDLSSSGKQELASRQQLSRQMMKKIASKTKNTSLTQPFYGFAKIETLPMLPQQETAKQILHDSANDPGILACMTKHQWNVECLKEMYPEGKVGESEVCVLGLNRNKGQEILLRLRTDDLKGFRKILSIRKVLFHELAHNVYSEHDSNFFQLNRIIEKECNELDWRREGHMLGGSSDTNYLNVESMEENVTKLVNGGTFRLGGQGVDMLPENKRHLSKREVAAKAAMLRMLKQESHECGSCACHSSTQEKNQHDDDDDDDDLHKNETI
jgi:hypothetical protein